MLFGKKRDSVTGGRGGAVYPSVEPELYVVAYENMQKGNKLVRRGKPIRQAAVVVDGTVKLITSGDKVERRTYDALIAAGILSVPGLVAEKEDLESEALPDPEGNS